MLIESIHHVALIVSDYECSKQFYTKILGFRIAAENYRAERQSFKLDLVGPNELRIELFSFPNPPARVSRPEACGLRHLAFRVTDIDLALKQLTQADIVCEPIRVDEYTGKRYLFFADPDGLPLELYEERGDVK